jgi:hypothetical protein
MISCCTLVCHVSIPLCQLQLLRIALFVDLVWYLAMSFVDLCPL